jgi:ABC-type transport system substrate-binding protein
MKFITLALLIFLSFSCTKSNTGKKNILNYALTSNVSTLDPAISYDTVSAKVVYQVYESLYEYDYLIRPYQLKPLLAKELPLIEEGGLKYTIKIKKNIRYHDNPAFKGKKVTVKAQDFINQIKRLAFKPTNSGGWWLFDNRIKGLNEFREKAKSDFSQFYSHNIEGLQAINDHTLVIKLNAPYPQLVYALGMAFTTPIPKELIDHYKNDLSQFAVGTGPYKLVSWKKNSHIKLLKNEFYHQSSYPSKGDRYAYENKLLKDAGAQLPFIEQINFHIMKEAQTRWLNFRNKNIDLMVLTKDHFPLALDNTGRLNKDFKKEDIRLQIAPTLTYWWLAFNMQHPILGKNLLLRKAIGHAVNIDEYIDSFTNNIALKANSIYPPGVNGYSPANELPYKYDVPLAKKYLAEAGYPNGEGLPEFAYDVRGSTTVSRQMGEFIEKELSKIGVKIKVNLNSFPGFLNKAKTGQLQMWQGGWAMDYPDPENVIQLLITKNHPPGPNSTFYSNPKVDKLYKDLFHAIEPEDVREVTKEVESLVSKDLPWIMQYYSRNYILHHGHLQNFRQSDLVNNNFKYLKLE